MSILKNRKDHKHVGASLPSPVSSYMVLYCMAKGVSKTNIIKPLMENWLKTTKSKYPEKTLINDIISRINLQYIAECSVKSISLIDFKNMIATELQKKGFTEKDIYTIISGIDGKNK